MARFTAIQFSSEIVEVAIDFEDMSGIEDEPPTAAIVNCAM